MLFSAAHDLLLFKPINIIDFEPPQDQAEGFKLPFVWTLFTSTFVETNLFYLLIHLALINYIVIKNKSALEHIWRRSDFFYMVCVAGFLSTTTHFVWRLSMFAVFKNGQAYRDFEYGSINLITMALVLGLRQASSHQLVLHRQSQGSAISFSNPTIKTEFDSGIPFISGNIVVPYAILPQLYMVASLLVAFIFEQPFDLRVLIEFFWVWLYLRFFMRIYASEGEFQVGDLSPEFAVSTFFPQKMEAALNTVSEVSFAFFNMCGFVNMARNWLGRRQEVGEVKALESREAPKEAAKSLEASKMDYKEDPK